MYKLQSWSVTEKEAKDGDLEITLKMGIVGFDNTAEAREFINIVKVAAQKALGQTFIDSSDADEPEEKAD